MTSQAANSDASYRFAPDARALNHIPGDDGWPLLGRTLAVLRDLSKVADEHLRRFGPVSRITVGGQRGLLVADADLFQRILVDTERGFSAEMGYVGQLGVFYPRGLLLSDFDEHRVNRRLMQAAFKVEALRRYLAMLQPIVAQHVEQWVAAGQIVFYPRIKALLLEVAAHCFLGLTAFERERDRVNRLFLDLNAGLIAVLRADLPFGAHGRAKRARRLLEAWFARLIAERRAAGSGGDDALSRLCRESDEQGRPFAVDVIVDQMIFLLFAAHDTATSTLTHLAMHLGRDAALQQRLRDHVAGAAAPLAHEDLLRFDFAGHCFNEALRLHPPVPMMMRRTLRDGELAGHRVPAHTLLFMPSMTNQLDPRWWSEPARFDPDRFAAPRSEHKRHAMAFHPFGGGAHKCIGLHFAEMVGKAVLHAWLPRARLATPPGYAPRLQWVPLPKPADGVPLCLTSA